MSRWSKLLPAAGAALLLVALGGCGGSHQRTAAAPTSTSADFPSSTGKTIGVLRRGLDATLVLAPTVSVVTPGTNRFGFGLFDRSHRQLRDAEVALYVERSGTSNVTGPFSAAPESLAVEPRFESETVKNDPDAVTSLYVTRLRFPSAGTYVVQAIAKRDGRMIAADPMPVIVSRSDPVPAVGSLAPRVHTPTAVDVHGDVRQIDTRQPPDTMHDVDLYDVLGRRAAVLLFATPALCQSRVCGPVTDLAEEVKSEQRGRVAFIQNEIYLDNQIRPGCLQDSRPQSQCVRPQVIAYHLPSEPWLFAIDRRGRVAARLEGAFSKNELESAVKAALTR